MSKEGGAMYRVAVLMSTYNGERYLKEQIDSILDQEGVDTALYIRDDESADQTVQIIEEYRKKYPGKIHLLKGRNKGPGRSFMELVYKVPDDYDYYAYSDQDDIWLTDKLEEGIRFLNESGKELYILPVPRSGTCGTELDHELLHIHGRAVPYDAV